MVLIWALRSLPPIAGSSLMPPTVPITVQFLSALFLLFVTVVAGIFKCHRNRLLIAFNPVLLVLWLCCPPSCVVPPRLHRLCGGSCVVPRLMPGASRSCSCHYFMVVSFAVASVRTGCDVIKDILQVRASCPFGRSTEPFLPARNTFSVRYRLDKTALFVSETFWVKDSR